jgi:hypothetical protein
MATPPATGICAFAPNMLIFLSYAALKAENRRAGFDPF